MKKGKAMSKSDLEVVAPLVVEYYKWLIGRGGTDPKVLLSKRLTASQREMLLDRLDDTNVVFSITSALREGVGPGREATLSKT